MHGVTWCASSTRYVTREAEEAVEIQANDGVLPVWTFLIYSLTYSSHVAAAQKRSHQWCLTPEPQQH